MISQVNKDTIWETHDGCEIPLGMLDDIHIANILDFMKQIHGELIFDDPIYSFLLDLAKERGLEPESLDRAQIPYRNKNGKWEIFKDGKFMEVSK